MKKQTFPKQKAHFSKTLNTVPLLDKEIQKISLLAKPLGYSKLSFLSRGKRGYIFLADYNKKKVCIKSKNPNSKVNTLLNEYNFLKRLKDYNLCPLPIKNHQSFISMQFIEGLPFERFLETYIEKDLKTKIIHIIWQLIDQMLLLDLLGINKQEMTHPAKHILITQRNITQGNITQRNNEKNKEFHPILIDFERARFSKNPKNLTQFISYLNSKKISSLLIKKDILINSQTLMIQVKKYKRIIKTDNNFSQGLSNISSLKEISIEIKKNIWLNPSNFSEKVLSKTILIPKGKVTSYGHIAKELNTKAFRAVGVVLSKNQFAPVVPCHRVVCSNGFIGGFNGGYEKSNIKEKLLKSEGIKIYKLKDKSVVPKRYFLE